MIANKNIHLLREFDEWMSSFKANKQGLKAMKHHTKAQN